MLNFKFTRLLNGSLKFQLDSIRQFIHLNMGSISEDNVIFNVAFDSFISVVYFGFISARSAHFSPHILTSRQSRQSCQPDADLTWNRQRADSASCRSVTQHAAILNRSSTSPPSSVTVRWCQGRSRWRQGVWLNEADRTSNGFYYSRQ